MRTILLVISALALAACSKSGDKSATPRDKVLDAWKAEKLEPSAMAAAQVAFGKDCQGGIVESIDGRGTPAGSAAEGRRGLIDVLLCNFASPAEAKAAEDAGLAWVGQATGASQARGAALVVLADRKKSDPNGRTINRLLKLAPKLAEN